ncbi:coiled-coil domain-containing protein 14 [Arapaima gigas]
MARQGLGKQHKVISSGRLMSSGRAVAGKKKAPGKRLAPAYSLYSTDSEDQVTTIHMGLDRCAALLNGILQTEERADGKTSCSKPGKATFSKTKAKLQCEKLDNVQKKHVKRIVSATQPHTRPVVVEKTVLSSQSYPGARQQCNFHTERSGAGQPALMPGPIPSLASQAPPQNKLPSSQVPQSASLSSTGIQNSTVFNCRLTTSTPNLSPPRANNLIYSSPEMVQPAQQSVLPANLGSHPQRQEAHFPTQVPCTCLQPEANRPCLEELVQVHQEPCACFPKASSQYVTECSDSQSLAAMSAESSEYSDGTTTDEDELNSVDITPVRDTSCQSCFSRKKLCPEAKKMSPTKTAKKVMTVKCLLGKLKALVAEKADCEALRLIAEVEQSVDLLPSIVGSTNIQAEIALAVQPLRSENAQLRRRLRIVNQQLMERERAEREARPADCNFELISLQSMNLSLQSQLKEAQKDVEVLRKRNEDLQQENGLLRKATEDKERELQEGRRQCELDISRIRIDVDSALSEMKSCQFKLEGSEQENKILNLRLQQQEAEISRLRELSSRQVPCSMPSFSDLHLEKETPNPTSHLSKAVLDLFEHEQKEVCPTDPVPGSINMYLKTLEVNGQMSSSEAPISPEKTHTEWSRRARQGEEKSHSPTQHGVCSAAEHRFHLSLGREQEQGGATYVPSRETVKVQLTGSPVKSLGGKNSIQDFHEAKFLSETLKKLHLSKGSFSGISGDFTVRRSSSVDLSASKNVPSLNEYQSLPAFESRVKANGTNVSGPDSTFLSCDTLGSNWTTSSWSTFNTQDELNFRHGLAALDASIASLQKTIQSDLNR